MFHSLSEELKKKDVTLQRDKMDEAALQPHGVFTPSQA